MSAPLALSARWTAAQRAQETARADRLFHDGLAAALAGEEGLAALKMSEAFNPSAPDTAAYLAVRTRFFDDFVADMVDAGLRQVVLLAAGLDSRAFRLDLPEGVSWWELDLPEVLDAKCETLAAQQAEHRCAAWACVPADLTCGWTDALLQAGFRPEAPSLWLVEGLLYYLEEADARRLLAEASRLAAPGSALGCDMVSASFFTSPFTAPARAVLAARGWAWRFGVDDPEGFYESFGWRATVRQPGEAGAHFGRWLSPVPPRDLVDLPHSFLIEAIRA
jgi:methyltransferase (TIGR00027 family)